MELPVGEPAATFGIHLAIDRQRIGTAEGIGIKISTKASAVPVDTEVRPSRLVTQTTVRRERNPRTGKALSTKGATRFGHFSLQPIRVLRQVANSRFLFPNGASADFAARRNLRLIARIARLIIFNFVRIDDLIIFTDHIDSRWPFPSKLAVMAPHSLTQKCQ